MEPSSRFFLDKAIMNNKIILLLSLFLSFSTATQCMKRLPSEKDIIDFTQPKKQKIYRTPIAKLQHKRNKLLNALQYYDLKADNPYLTKHCAEDLLILIKGFHARNQTTTPVCCIVGMLMWTKVCPYVLAQTHITHEQHIALFQEQSTKYSLAGLLTMSIKNCIPCPMTYQEKKERLLPFLDKFPDASTPKDQDLAIVEKWERCENIIKNITVFRLCSLHSENLREILPEIINDITLLMFATEESLL